MHRSQVCATDIVSHHPQYHIGNKAHLLWQSGVCNCSPELRIARRQYESSIAAITTYRSRHSRSASGSTMLSLCCGPVSSNSKPALPQIVDKPRGLRREHSYFDGVRVYSYHSEYVFVTSHDRQYCICDADIRCGLLQPTASQMHGSQLSATIGASPNLCVINPSSISSMMNAILQSSDAMNLGYMAWDCRPSQHLPVKLVRNDARWQMSVRFEIAVAY